MTVSGKMTRPTASVSTLTWMKQDTKETGKKISSMARDLRLGLMVPHMREAISMGRSTDLESSHGLTAALMRASSLRITSMGKVREHKNH